MCFAKSALPLIAMFSPKIKLFYEGRKNLLQNIENEINGDSSPKAWFHSASLGEFEQGYPVIEKFMAKNPYVKIIVTFFSPSGYTVKKQCKQCKQIDYIFYMPYDTIGDAKKFIKLINPVFAVFIKYEFWANHLYYLKKYNIPIYSISSIFREKQVYFKFYGAFFRRNLKYFSHFFVQDENSEKLLASVGIGNASVTGDTRFDRVLKIMADSERIKPVEQFVDNKMCIVAGSTWQPDEEIIVEYVRQNSNIKLIIAPHEVKPENIARIGNLFGNRSTVFSEITENDDLSESNVLIIDNMGMLSSLYRYGKIAYVGGGFGAGIHNVLEAATYGVPVIFGHNYQKFSEAVDLINLGAAFPVNSATELTAKIELLLTDSEQLKSSGEKAKKYVCEHAGATEIIVQMLTDNYNNRQT
jgi:3-deoxy-D-manno-octulosonic-acid transferase